KWCSHFVFNYFYSSAATYNFLTFFDLGNLADVESDRSIEFKCLTARGSLRITEHDADLHADLVNEDNTGFGASYDGSELTERLGHKASLFTHMVSTHEIGRASCR